MHKYLSQIQRQYLKVQQLLQCAVGLQEILNDNAINRSQDARVGIVHDLHFLSRQIRIIEKKYKDAKERIEILLNLGSTISNIHYSLV